MPTNDRALLNACSSLLRQNLGVRPNERVLILTDSHMKSIGNTFLRAACALTQAAELLEIPPGDYNGQEPPPAASQSMLNCDVLVAPLAKSISWTSARRKASDRGVRIATLPGITAEVLIRNFPADYETIRSRVNLLADQLDQGSSLRIRTSTGTDLSFSIAGREAHGRKGGIFNQPGFWGNLPCGEAFIAPVEGTGIGTYLIDGSLPGIGKLDEPVSVRVEGGRAVAIQGGDAAGWLENALEKVRDPLAFNLAEFGIGCNHQARITGITLEDEKALGTCHLALGSNAFFGGKIQCGIHLDGVLKRPDVWIDDNLIISQGTHLISA